MFCPPCGISCATFCRSPEAFLCGRGLLCQQGLWRNHSYNYRILLDTQSCLIAKSSQTFSQTQVCVGTLLPRLCFQKCGYLCSIPFRVSYGGYYVVLNIRRPQPCRVARQRKSAAGWGVSATSCFVAANLAWRCVWPAGLAETFSLALCLTAMLDGSVFLKAARGLRRQR